MSLLELHEITDSGAPSIAINEPSFSVSRAAWRAPIGPNGAGKTTVFNCITGNYRPEHGSISFGGRDITGKAPAQYRGDGHRPYLPEHPPVRQAARAGKRAGGTPLPPEIRASCPPCCTRLWQRREEKAAVARCMEELEFVGLADHYAEAASSLSYGNQRLLEIARALASDPAC